MVLFDDTFDVLVQAWSTRDLAFALFHIVRWRSVIRISKVVALTFRRAVLHALHATETFCRLVRSGLVELGLCCLSSSSSCPPYWLVEYITGVPECCFQHAEFDFQTNTHFLDRI